MAFPGRNLQFILVAVSSLVIYVRIMLFITDAALTRKAMADAARKLGVPGLAVPRKIHCVDSLPLPGTGKVDYVSLKHLAEPL